MVLESRLAELLQGQAKKFINGFNAEHLNLGLLSGFLELRNLALNPEPIDELLLGSDLPFVVKAGTLSSAMLQLSLMQGELEIVVDGLTLVMAPACKWLTREEVYQHRTNEMERLEFVHMRSQSQRRSLEREMFRKLFSDYLSRIKITVKNVHVRVEIEGEKCQMRETGHPLSLGLVMNSCDIVPVVETEKGGGGAAGGARESEFLLAETMQLKGLMLYEEGLSKTLVPWSLYQSTRTCELGIFQKMSQDEFVRTMNQTREAHGAVPAGQLLLPPTDVSIKVDLKSQALFTDCHVENCLTLEMVVCLQNPSRLRVTASIVEGMRWLVRRTFDFQMWPFLHALHGKPANGLGRWHVLRSFLALKRRIQSNTYSLPDALRMRIHCKEYIRLYKKKFNGPQSSFHWRRSLPPLTAEDATRLGLIELTYPAEKLVNFRLMAQTEMKTETSINSFAEEGALGDFKRSPRSQVWQVRELTPMEQLHLHGQHGFGTNIFRGLPPPPSNLKVRIDLVAPLGLWWVCKLGAAGDEGSWAVSLDSGRQPVRLLLVDSISDNSVFATCEVPRRAESRPAAVLLARSEAAFQRVLERAPNQLGGGSGASEWSSMLEFHGDLCCWGQVKTLPMAASHSPWDFFGSFSCGQSSSTPNDTSFGRVTPLDELLAKFPRMHGSMLQSASSTAGQQEPFLRMNLPLRLTSGQDGPFLELLRWCLATPEGRGGANSQSMLSGLAMLVRSGYDLAALRLHVSLPKVFLQGVNCHETPLQLPPFDAACHLENGGLVDGFVVGLHNLYNFANLVASMPDVKRPKAANVVPASNARRQMSNVQPVSLHFLEQAPPLLLALGALLAASAVVLAGGHKSCMASKCGEGHELVKLATENGLFGVAAGRTTGEPTLAGITLIPTLLAVLLGRRALYDRLQGQRGDHADPSEVFKFFAATLHVLLAMGFPVHRSSLPLAAWVGSVELLQVLSQGCKDFNVTSTQGTELMSWSARGVYANPAKGPVQVLKWLMHRKASPEQRDSAGRSVLDWACWAGCDELVSFLLRRRPALDDPQPLLLAAASRSSSLVRLLLRAAGDPHAVPNTGDSHSAACGALMLAVRCCEFELACEVLRSAGAVNVAVALGTGRSAPRLGMENEEKPGSATRATVALVESFCRFANGLQRRSVEEVSVAGIRAHLPGPHPDENLYATSNMPLGDVLHPLVAKLSSPMHRVPLELRPGLLPLAWLRRTSTPDPWAPARLMVECLVQRGFRADAAFLSKVGLALPPEVQSLTGRLTEGTEGAPMLPMLLTDIIPDMRRADEISILKDAYGMPVEMFNGKMKFPTLSKGMVDELQKAGVYEEKTVIPSVADYLKDLCAPPPPEVPRPAIRVVVFGAPRVGKSTVTKILADYLEVSYEEDDGPRRLRTVQGCWPLSGTPLVEVLLWDTAQDLPDLITDSRAATFAVAVVDGADGSGSAIAAAMAQGCVSDEAQSTAPRRALIVENCFPERDLDETETNTTGRSSTHPLLQTIQCNVLDEEGQNSLKKVFGKIMAEMVGQIEARQEASKSVEKPLQPCGQGDFREVLARDSSLPCSARKPLGRRAHAYRLRGLSMCVDPVAASMAWQALQAARSTLPHEVQNLTGSSPPSSSWRSALVAPEPLQQTLQMGEAGVSGENLSATLRRALLELSLICPVQAGKDASVLVPDFAERINISASMVRQLLDSPKSIFLRLVWSREKHSARAPPSLRRTLRKFFSLTSRPFVLRYFARLDGQSAFPPEIGANSPSPECTECSVMRGAQRVGLDSDLEPGFILAFDSSVDSPAHLDQTGHSSVPGLADLLAAPALGLTFLLVMAGPNDTWDVLSSGPKATWAWRAFASHLPKFTGLVPAAAARGTRRAAEDAARRTPAPRWALRVQSGAAAGAALSLEELATTAWLLAGPQSKDVRDSLVLDQSFSSFCCAALCGSRGLRGHLEDPAEELEVRLFMRSWREIPYFLNESLQSSESWSLCAFCLQRFARDFELVGVSKRGAYLPFLQLQGEQVFAFHLDPERPAAASKSPVLQMEAELPSALHAWLTICQPLALWAACGARNATGGVSAADGMQIAKALQKACSSGFFSEQQNLELREALREKAVMPLNGEA